MQSSNESCKRKLKGLLRLLLLILLLEHALERSLDLLDKEAKTPEQGAEAEAPALDTDGVNEKVHQHVVRRCEYKEDAKITPLLFGQNVERSHVLVSIGVRAHHAVLRSIGLQEVATRRVGESTSVLSASLSRWWIKDSCFRLRTFNGLASKGSGQHTADPPSRRVDPVHPVAPEDGKL